MPHLNRGRTQALENFSLITLLYSLQGNFSSLPHQKCNGAPCTDSFAHASHEEKETDVNIALHLLRDAYENIYDKAILVSQDSDLCPAVAMVREKLPDKKLKTITPLNAQHSGKMTKLVGKEYRGMIKAIHLKNSLLDRVIILPNGKKITRPEKYDPPDFSA